MRWSRHAGGSAVTVMTLAHRRAARLYREALLERVRQVPCPVCQARARSPCTGRLGLRKWCHAVRHTAAKEVGILRGRRIEVSVADVPTALLEAPAADTDQREDSWLSLDPVGVWLANNPAAIRQLAGKRVAIHPVEGIIASGDTFEQVYAEVSRRGMLDVVTFESIPRLAPV